MSIKGWIILFVNSLIIITTLTVSFFFYQTFQNTLDERVLLQLKSIKRLKRVQVENYLTDKWTLFETQADTNSAGTEVINSLEELPYTKIKFVEGSVNGVYDISAYYTEGSVELLFIKRLKDSRFLVKKLKTADIDKILLERTGMGQSGETYIVGADYHLRTQSRFFTKQNPYAIIAKTEGVTNAFSGNDGAKIITDYRGEMVYSAFHVIKYSHINWCILSEIDLKEVAEPLDKMRNQLYLICLTVLTFVIVIGLFFTNKISQPIQQVSLLLNKMAKGQYSVPIKVTGLGTEVFYLYESLKKLQDTLTNAVDFANEIGMTNSRTTNSFKAASNNDPLGESLIAMQDKLIDFQRKAERNQIVSKQQLIKGQENERKRLSKELHDGIGPLLTSLKLMIQAADLGEEKKKLLKDLIDTTITEVRRMSYDLMPQSLMDFGVGKAVNHWISLINKSSTVEIDYEDSTENDDESVRNFEVEVCVFRVIQELINNTIKHAEATKIRISLTEFDEKISLFYTDNGRGFNMENAKFGSGINNIKERVSILEGYLSFESSNKGTKVEVELPI